MRIHEKYRCAYSKSPMIVNKILNILKLPKTLVVGNLNKAYNSYTLFLPYRESTEYDFILITELNLFSKQRIRMNVPYNALEEYICTALINHKKVFALQSAAIPGTIIIPDTTTRLITKSMAGNYPFKTMFIPQGALITPLAAEERIEFKEFRPCESEKYAEVFGQPKNVKN